MSQHESHTKETFGASLARQLASNGYSILLETIIMAVIAAYAVMEIREVKRDVSDRIETSHHALMAYGKEQGDKLDLVTSELAQTTELLASVIGVTVEDFKANREEMYEQAKEGGKQAFRDYLREKFGGSEAEPTKE